jgi:hypothetical protein
MKPDDLAAFLEKMTPLPLYARGRFLSRVPNNTGMGATVCTNHVANFAETDDAQGVAAILAILPELMELWVRAEEYALGYPGATQGELDASCDVRAAVERLRRL